MATGELGLVAPQAGSNNRSINLRWAAAAACAAMLLVATVALAMPGGRPDSLVYVFSVPKNEAGHNGYKEALSTDSHAVFVRGMHNVQQMDENGVKFAVPCAFGIKCHEHVRPQLKERTDGAWLHEDGIGNDLPTTNQLISAPPPTSGPWLAGNKDAVNNYTPLGSTTGSETQEITANVQEVGTGSAGEVQKAAREGQRLADKAAKIKAQISHLMSAYDQAADHH